MPKCKSCHRTITKFDTDVCPYCGATNPIEEGYKTMDITQTLATQKDDSPLCRSKSRLATCLLCVFFGIFGVHYFYLGYWKKGLAILLIDLSVMIGLGFLLHLWLAYYFAFPIVYACFWLYFIIRGIFYKNQIDLKDANGILLR